MTILTSLFDILVSFVSHSYLTYWFFPFVALAFVATVPSIIRSLVSWR